MPLGKIVSSFREAMMARVSARPTRSDVDHGDTFPYRAALHRWDASNSSDGSTTESTLIAASLSRSSCDEVTNLEVSCHASSLDVINQSAPTRRTGGSG